MSTPERARSEKRNREPSGFALFRQNTSWPHYVLAVALPLIAFGIRTVLGSVLGDELPFLLFVAAALTAAWYGGAFPGSLALLLGLMLAEYFFHPLQGKSRVLDSLDVIRFLRYVFTGSLGVVLIGILRREKDRAKSAAENLTREVQRRMRSEAALEEAKNLLSRHAEELERCVAERTTELSASIKSLEDILYHIAHNFRAPVRAMEGFIRLLENEYGENWDARARDYAKRISTSSKQLERLIIDLLAYGRLTHAHVRLVAVNLEPAVDHAISELSNRIKATNTEIAVQRPLPDVCADHHLLNQVVFQLLDNAIKFVPVGRRPRIRIWADSNESVVRLWVQDNGVGIEPRYQEKVFMPFERQVVVEGYEGNGIGLAVVKEGAQRMGGCTGVESQPGVGSRFWVELPNAVCVEDPQLSEHLIALAGSHV